MRADGDRIRIEVFNDTNVAFEAFKAANDERMADMTTEVMACKCCEPRGAR